MFGKEGMTAYERAKKLAAAILDEAGAYSLARAVEGANEKSGVTSAMFAVKHILNYRREMLEEAANELEQAFSECDTLNLLHGAARIRSLIDQPTIIDQGTIITEDSPHGVMGK